MEALLILLIFAGTIALIASPFFKKGTDVWESAGTDSRLDRLKSTKDLYYTAIKDVDFEYAEGKLSEKDYNELREYYKEKAIVTIKEMDKYKVSQPAASGGQYTAVGSHKKGKKEHK